MSAEILSNVAHIYNAFADLIDPPVEIVVVVEDVIKRSLEDIRMLPNVHQTLFQSPHCTVNEVRLKITRANHPVTRSVLDLCPVDLIVMIIGAGPFEFVHLLYRCHVRKRMSLELLIDPCPVGDLLFPNAPYVCFRVIRMVHCEPRRFDASHTVDMELVIQLLEIAAPQFSQEAIRHFISGPVVRGYPVGLLPSKQGQPSLAWRHAKSLSYIRLLRTSTSYFSTSFSQRSEVWTFIFRQ